MKNSFIGVVFLASLFISNHGIGQCKADSVVTYRNVGGYFEVATVEYFSYDENDSLVFQDFFQYQNSKKSTVSQITIERKKVKGKWVVEKNSASWNSDQAVVNPVSKSISTYDKKGKLTSEVHQDFKLIGAQSNYINQSKFEYVYSKTGLLIEQTMSVWNVQKSSWQSDTKVSTTYNAANLSKETITTIWDTTKNVWANSWKHEFGYDSLNVINEAITYKFIKGVWVPHARTEYGKDPKDPMKYNIVQKWHGDKNKWINEFYYIFQMDEFGKTKTEVHLSWTGKEWKIDLTVYYVYNDKGELSQILNENKQVIVEWFCR